MRRSKRLRVWLRGTTRNGCPPRGRRTCRRRGGTSRLWPSKKLVRSLIFMPPGFCIISCAFCANSPVFTGENVVLRASYRRISKNTRMFTALLPFFGTDYGIWDESIVLCHISFIKQESSTHLTTFIEEKSEIVLSF